MTDPINILEFAKKCASGSTMPIRQVELAQALLIAVDALELIQFMPDVMQRPTKDNPRFNEAIAESINKFKECKSIAQEVMSLLKPFTL